MQAIIPQSSGATRSAAMSCRIANARKSNPVQSQRRLPRSHDQTTRRSYLLQRAPLLAQNTLHHEEIFKAANRDMLLLIQHIIVSSNVQQPSITSLVLFGTSPAYVDVNHGSEHCTPRRNLQRGQQRHASSIRSAPIFHHGHLVLLSATEATWIAAMTG